MKIYTSYWAQVRNFPKNLVGLSTVKCPPKWRPLGQDKRGVWVLDCPILKPGFKCEGLCRGDCIPKHPQDCTFLKVYYEQLTAIDFTYFINQLQRLHDDICAGEGLDDVDFAIIVYEKYDNPCSERSQLTRWLKNHGIEVTEWSKQ